MSTGETDRQPSEVGVLLRDVRLQRGKSLRQLAERSGFGRSTLSRWERGTVLPDASALETLLASLGLSPEERLRFIRSVNERSPSGSHHRVGRKLLRAARLRNGMSLSQAATRIGVAKATLSRWETGDRNPSRRTMARAAEAIGATEAEISTIASPEPVLQPLAAAYSTDTEALKARVRALRDLTQMGGVGLADIDFLGLDAAIAPIANADAKRLRRELRVAYIQWLGWWYRDAEAGAYAAKLLPAMRKEPSSGIWGRVLRAVANDTSEIKNDPEEAIERLADACAILQGGASEGIVRRELGGLLLSVGDRAGALEQVRRALDARADEEGPAVHLYCCSMLEAAVWSNAGIHDRALSCLPTVRAQDPYLISSSAIGRSRILARAGELAAARAITDSAMHDARADGLSHFYLSLARFRQRELE